MALSAGLGLTGVAAQDPMFDLQVATPVSTDNVLHVTGVITPDQKVSAQFRSAKIGDVLDWLEKQGVDFIIADSDVKKDATVSLKVTDQPVEKVLDALATAFGGRWERTGDLRVFRKGDISFGTISGSPVRVTGTGWSTMSTDNVEVAAPAAADAKLWKMPAVPPLPHNFVIQTLPKIDATQQKEFQQRMEEVAKTMQKSFGPEFQKKMDEAMKAVPAAPALPPMEVQIEAKAEAQASADEAAVAVVEAKSAIAEAMKNADDAARTTVVRRYSVRSGNSTQIGTFNPTKFLKTVTPKQKAIAKKRGYLKIAELTPLQRRSLGITDVKGQWTMSFSVNGESLIIKN